MKDPKIAKKGSVRVALEPGTYWWCACGLSATQPFCDGSHKETGFSPIKIELDEPKSVSLCQCKHSKNKPFCDGSHRNL